MVLIASTVGGVAIGALDRGATAPDGAAWGAATINGRPPGELIGPPGATRSCASSPNPAAPPSRATDARVSDATIA